jgi:hypothetical protein
MNTVLGDIGLCGRPVFTAGRSSYQGDGDTHKAVDNLLKFTMDLVVGPLLADDCFICEVRGIKSKEPDIGNFCTDVEVKYYID